MSGEGDDVKFTHSAPVEKDAAATRREVDNAELANDEQQEEEVLPALARTRGDIRDTNAGSSEAVQAGFRAAAPSQSIADGMPVTSVLTPVENDAGALRADSHFNSPESVTGQIPESDTGQIPEVFGYLVKPEDVNSYEFSGICPNLEDEDFGQWDNEDWGLPEEHNRASLWRIELDGNYIRARLRFDPKRRGYQVGRRKPEDHIELESRTGKGRWGYSREEADRFRDETELVANSLEPTSKKRGASEGKGRKRKTNTSGQQRDQLRVVRRGLEDWGLPGAPTTSSQIN